MKFYYSAIMTAAWTTTLLLLPSTPPTFAQQHQNKNLRTGRRLGAKATTTPESRSDLTTMIANNNNNNTGTSQAAASGLADTISNRRQLYVRENGWTCDTDVGTAPGHFCESDNCVVSTTGSFVTVTSSVCFPNEAEQNGIVVTYGKEYCISGSSGFEYGHVYVDATSDRVTGFFFNDNALPPNDWVKSVRFKGPLQKGTWLQLSDSGKYFAGDDAVNIMLEKDLADGEYSTCVNLNGEHFASNGLRVRYSTYNGLSGKVSNMMIREPAFGDGDLTVKLLRNLEWTPKFSEENGGYSPNWVAPVVGLSCSGNRCDDKWLLQARASSCRAGGQQVQDWTDWISEETDWARCPNGWIVGRMQCRGRYCDDIRLGCYRPPSGCELDSNVPLKGIRARAGEEEMCPTGWVMVASQCYGSFCSDVDIVCQKVKRVD